MRSNSVGMMLANTGPREDPIETPSVCSYNSLLKEKNGFIATIKDKLF